MKKEIYTNLKAYTFDADRKGAKYTFNNIHWMNNGDFSEAQYKHVLGFEAEKDGNTPFDVGSDIEPLHRSVKSSKATLANMVLGNDKDSVLDCYFARTASTSFAWVVVGDECLTAYVMNDEEFRIFCQLWASYDESRKVVRFKATSGKMIAWFEEKLEKELEL